MNKDLNALEKAVLENRDAEIIHFIKEGLRVSHLDVLVNVENIKNENARYLLIKYGIAESELDKAEQVLAQLTDVSGCSETLMIFQSDESRIFEKSRKAGPDSVLKNAIADRDIDTIKECLERNEKIMELDTITFSMGLAGYEDAEVRWLFEEALTPETRCYFMMKLVEEAKSFGESGAGKIIAHYADILEEMLSAYTPKELEQAVRKADRSDIIIRIFEGDSLSKPELIASKKFFSKASIHSAMFLFEIGMTKAVKQQAILLLQKKYQQTGESWISEEIELLEDSLKPLPKEVSAEEAMLEKAIGNGDDRKVMELIEKDVRIRRPDALVDLSFTRLSVRTMIAVATRAVDLRVPPHVARLLHYIISYTSYSDKEYDARIMVQNLFLQVAFGTMTWENSQDETSLWPMDAESDDPDDDSSVDDSRNESAPDEQEQEEEHLWGYDNAALKEKYNVEVVTIKCPKCRQPIDFPLFDFVNISKHPELKEKILSQEVFTLVCSHCGQKTVVPAPMLYRDDQLQVFINICKSAEDAIAYRFPVDEPSFRDNFSEYQCRTVVGCNGLCEKIRIFDEGLNELAIAYLKKRIFEQHDDVREVFFECVDEGAIYFTLFLKSAPMMSVHFPRLVYEQAVGFVDAANIADRLSSYFIDVNVFDDSDK